MINLYTNNKVLKFINYLLLRKNSGSVFLSGKMFIFNIWPAPDINIWKIFEQNKIITFYFNLVQHALETNLSSICT